MDSLPGLPYGHPDEWLISFVDIETTGLKPGYHEMVDIGIVLANLEGSKQDTFFRRIMPARPGRAEEEAIACNGFSPARWEMAGAISKGQTVKEIMEFYNTAANDHHVVFCAYNESFDYPFLDHLFRSEDESIDQLYNYALDLPSIAWGQGIQCLHLRQLVDHLEIKDEPTASDEDTEPWEHTGLTGARLNHRIYQALIGNVQPGSEFDSEMV